jgi:sterol desaturase/sphingolipid hydroxylase (fatty acid hydroxylase superfamily)
LYFKDVFIIGSRYLIISTLAFVIAYLLLRKIIASTKIQQRFPRIKDYLREIGFSILTIFIMAFIPSFILGIPAIAKHTSFYTDIDQIWLAIFYSCFSPDGLFLHDTYFYWLHRLMHHPRLFRLVHLVHHQSTNPSPFAAYAFSPFRSDRGSGHNL